MIEFVVSTLQGAVTGKLLERGVPYMLEGRWRRGPLGSPLPERPKHLPPPNPIVRIAGAGPAYRRRMRAANMRARSR